MIKPEILAPAGDYNSMVAAVEAGADAVYFGGKNFSARSFAVNFGEEEIAKAIRYAHLRGVKCYVTVNTLIKDAEFNKLFDYINFLYAEGADVLIIQDLGVLNFCQKYFPDLPLHASTQMTAHNLNDVLELEKLGFKRIVLARELTLEEVLDIKKNSNVELECFVHGALCFSYSGQCYLSSMIGGRSGNRGKCAQPCRRKYDLVDWKTGKDLEEERYLLSTKDLCVLDILDKLMLIDSLKIEGRMKSPAYVGGVVEKYRKHIDNIAQKNKVDSKKDKEELAGIFNRGGFSHGYWLDKKPSDLVSPERSKNYGVKAGEVVEVRNGVVKIKVKNVKVNDGLEIWGRDGQDNNIGFRVDPVKSAIGGAKQFNGVDPVKSRKAGIAERSFDRVEKISEDMIQVRLEGDVKVGDLVYKTFDNELNKSLVQWGKENYKRRLSVQMAFAAEEGKNIILRINDVEVKGEIAEKAEKVATSEEKIKEQLSKLGNTPFAAEKVNVVVRGNLNIPLSSLNALRREAVAALEEKIVNSSKREKKQEISSSMVICITIPKNIEEKNKTSQKRICIQSNDPAVLNSVLGKGIFRVYTSLPVDMKKFREKGIEVFQALPRILRKGEKVKISENFDGFLVPALGYLQTLPKGAKKIADFSMNIFNNYSIQELKNLGFAGFTASIENTLKEINALGAEGFEKEAIVYGYLPLMIAEHCVLYKTEYCKKKLCGTCPHLFYENRESMPKNKIFFEKKSSIADIEFQKVGVKDEKGIVFPLFTDCINCRMQVLNSRPLYFTDIGDLEADNIRLMHTIETPEKFLKIVDNYLSGSFGNTENTTTGHFYRGVE